LCQGHPTYDPAVSEPLPRPAPDVVFRDLGDETVLVNLRSNAIFSLNATGSRFWTLLAADRDRDRIERQLMEEFDVDVRVLRQEIDELLAALAAKGLVA
jgi:hypothetical protein